jgi:uncharacterized small protein (DUF1192 family)
VYADAPASKRDKAGFSMFDETLPIQKKTVHEVGQDLAPLSIAEIDERITALQAEIERLGIARRDKLKTQAAADALFKR